MRHRFTGSPLTFRTIQLWGAVERYLRPQPHPGCWSIRKRFRSRLVLVYITFSAQGDSHNGSALLMKASVTDSSGSETACEPLAGQSGGGGGPTVFPHWYTLLKLPTDDDSTTGNNCDDGGSGTADCHDNAIMFSCCAQIRPDTAVPPTTHTVNIRLADLPGGDGNFAFYVPVRPR